MKYTSKVQKDWTFYSGSSSVIGVFSARSLLDCVDICLAKTDDRPCYGSLFITTASSDRAGNIFHMFITKCLNCDNEYLTTQQVFLYRSHLNYVAV